MEETERKLENISSFDSRMKERGTRRAGKVKKVNSAYRIAKI